MAILKWISLLALLPAITFAAGTIAPGQTHSYTFAVRFPDGGPNGADNIYKKASVEVDFNWEAVNN